MSDNKFPTLPGEKEVEVVEPTTDITAADLVKIQKYVDSGYPGLAGLTDAQLQRALDLYLSGKTYHQISRIMRLERPLILYLSHKFNWFPLRREVLSEMEHNIRGRVIEAKLESQDFLLKLTHAWQKKIGDKVEEYLRTGDVAHANAIDLKEVDKYLKTVEMLLKMSDAKPAGKGADKAPTVGLNLGDGGVTVKKVNDNEVEITPNNVAKSLLSQMADFRREQERSKTVQSSSNSSDIKNSTQGESDNEKK
jgi:hypothetical protein